MAGLLGRFGVRMRQLLLNVETDRLALGASSPVPDIYRARDGIAPGRGQACSIQPLLPRCKEPDPDDVAQLVSLPGRGTRVVLPHREHRLGACPDRRRKGCLSTL